MRLCSFSPPDDFPLLTGMAACQHSLAQSLLAGSK
jgi:hypothetical protein